MKNIFILINFLIFTNVFALETDIQITHDRFGHPRCFTWSDSKTKSQRSFFVFRDKINQKINGVFLENIIFKERFSHYRFKVDNCNEALKHERLITSRKNIIASKHINDHVISKNKLQSIFTPFKKETNKNLRDYYGTDQSSKLYLKWIDQKKLDPNCKNLIGTCDYYLCREMNHPCGSKGYYLSFGFQYCAGSMELLLPNASEKGKNWLTNVASCLQNKMEDIAYDFTCSDVKKRAIEDHDSCYSENKICRLPVKDIFAIYKLIRPELSNPQIIFEGLQVAEKCLN